jgi:phage/plasmid-like protein (TIGR03299 family)
MAHDLFINGRGEASMAYISDEGTPWHGLGYGFDRLTMTADEFFSKAGYDFEIVGSEVEYSHIIDPETGLSEIKTFPNVQALHRNDTGEPISIVSNRFKVVQPGQVKENLNKICDKYGLELSTAGVLGTGGKFWGLAKFGDKVNVSGDLASEDLVETFLLIATSADKSMSTVIKLTVIRVVCNNTLQLALGKADGKKAIKIPHSTEVDWSKIEVDMGFIAEETGKQLDEMKRIKQIGLNDEQAMKFFLELLKTPEEKKSGKVDIDKKKKELPKYWESYKAAPGAENTVWGAVNAVTHAVDYNKHARSDDTRLTSAWFGQGAIKKQAAYALATNDVELEKVMVEMVDGSLQEITHEEYAVKKTGIDGTGDLAGLLNKKVSNY